MDDFDAEMAESLASAESVMEMKPAVRSDRTYVEAVADMFDRLAACQHDGAIERYLPNGGLELTCIACGAVNTNGGRWL